MSVIRTTETAGTRTPSQSLARVVRKFAQSHSIRTSSELELLLELDFSLARLDALTYQQTRSLLKAMAWHNVRSESNLQIIEAYARDPASVIKLANDRLQQLGKDFNSVQLSEILSLRRQTLASLLRKQLTRLRLQTCIKILAVPDSEIAELIRRKTDLRVRAHNRLKIMRQQGLLKVEISAITGCNRQIVRRGLHTEQCLTLSRYSCRKILAVSDDAIKRAVVEQS